MRRKKVPLFSEVYIFQGLKPCKSGKRGSVLEVFLTSCERGFHCMHTTVTTSKGSAK